MLNICVLVIILNHFDWKCITQAIKEYKNKNQFKIIESKYYRFLIEAITQDIIQLRKGSKIMLLI